MRLRGLRRRLAVLAIVVAFGAAAGDALAGQTSMNVSNSGYRISRVDYLYVPRGTEITNVERSFVSSFAGGEEVRVFFERANANTLPRLVIETYSGGFDHPHFFTECHGSFFNRFCHEHLDEVHPHGGGYSATYTATWVDVEPPRVIAPPDLFVGTDSGCTYTGPIGVASATDNLGGVLLSNDAPASFPLGRTDVTWTARDTSFNSGTALQIVIVFDDDDPTITPPGPLTVGPNSGATYVGGIGSPIANDNCSSGSAVTITNDAPTAFPMGTTTVTWTATDAAGNSATATQQVTVADDVAPSVTAPADVTAGTDTGCTYTGPIGAATATDNVSSGAALAITNNAPASFPLGSTTVTWTATDAAGNSGTATQQVTVFDDDAPSITPPAALTVGTNSGATYIGAIGAATAADNCSSEAAIMITNDTPAAFPIGMTTVTWTATDAAGNQATATQQVTVVDDDAPSVSPPADLAVGTDSGCTYTGPIGLATAQDNVAVASITSDAPAAFALGNTTVTWTATDAAGNSSSATQVVTVVDDDDPTITAPGDVSRLHDPGQAAAHVSDAALGAATAADNCGGVTISRTGVPAGNVFPVGTTTITYTATDASGNTATATQKVTIINSPPSANSGGGPYEVGEGGAVQLSGSGNDPDGDPLTFNWDLDGDGTYETPGQNVTFSAATIDGPANRDVALQVCDDAGACGVSRAAVLIRNVDPTANAGGDQLTEEGTLVGLVNPGFSDSGIGDSHTVSIAWGDGSPASSALDATHRYADNGMYVVTLTVTDDDGGVGTDTATITVTNAAPTAQIDGAPTSSPEGTQLSLTSSVGDAGSADTHTYGWSVTKNGAAYASGTSNDFSFTPNDNGTYVVSFTATDDDGGGGSDSETITVTNVTPTLLFAAANRTSLPEGPATTTETYSYTISDPGSADTHTVGGLSCGTLGTVVAGSHVRSANGGSFRCTINTLEGSATTKTMLSATATDDDGGAGTGTQEVAVANVAPSVTITSPVPNGTYSRFSNIAVVARFSDSGTRDTHTCSIDLGNGKTVAGTVSYPKNGSPSCAGTINYNGAAGNYVVTVTVTDDDGGPGSATSPITAA